MGIHSDKAKLKHSDYLFVVDGDAHIDDPEVLRELLKMNKFVDLYLFIEKLYLIEK